MENAFGKSGLVLAVLLNVSLAMPQTARAGEAEISALARLFTEEATETWFAPVLLNQLPVARLTGVIDQVSSGLGEYRNVVAEGSGYKVMFDNGYVPSTIHLDSNGQIDGLFFRPPVINPDANIDTKPASGPEAERLASLFTSDISDDWFDPSFLNQVPVSQISNIVSQYTSVLGKFEGVMTAPGGYRLQFEKGYAPAKIQLNENGKVMMLFFQPPVTEAESASAAVDRFRELPGKTAVAVHRNGQSLASHNADLPLAIGSAFKLSVLAALKQKITAGDASWGDVMTLTQKSRSLPSGTLQNWPDGAALTLYSLAARMISESDNTATDLLIDYLGREAVEAVAPERNRPFLKTREFFVLKAPENRELGHRYLKAGAQGRAAILKQTQNMGPPADPGAFTQVQLMEVEWFYSANELCQQMNLVEDLPLTGINDGGLANAERWDRVSFKGGSETGVMNLTYGLGSDDGDRYCVSVTQNHNEPLDQVLLVGLTHGLIDQIAN